MAYQPKSYRKFLATSMSAAMVASAVAPLATSAATPNFTDISGHWAENDINALAAKGAIAGIGDGKFGPELKVTREQAAAILMNAEGLDYSTPAADPGFADVKAGSYWYNTVAGAKAHGIFSGDGVNFGLGDTLTRGELAAILVRTLGVEDLYDASSYTSAFTDIASNQFKKQIVTLEAIGAMDGASATKFDPSGVVTRAQFAAALEKTYKAIANLDPKVVSVSAVNAKEVTVTFNKALEKSSVIDSTDGTLQSNVILLDDTDATNYYASLSKDGKTLTIQLPSYTANANVKFELVNDGTNYITTAQKEDVPAFVTTFKTVDTTRATFNKIEYVTPELVRVHFSEPIVQPVGGEYSVAYTDGTTGATLTPENITGADVDYVEFDISGLTEDKEATIVFNSITDFAGNISTPVTVNVKNSDEDKVAPTVTSITATSPTTFEIKYSESIKDLGLGAVKVNGTAITGAAGSVGVSTTDSTVVEVTLTTPVSTAVPVVVEADVAVDYNNNSSKAFSQVLNFAADSTGPVLQSTKVVNKGGDNFLVLTFDEDVNIVSTDDLAFEYNDKFGITQSITVPNANINNSATSDKVVEILLEDDATPAVALPSNIAFSVDFAKGFFQDGFGNDAAAKTVGVTINGTVGKLALASGTPIADEANKGGTLLVDFAAPVDLASATNAANYTVEGATVEKAELVTNSDSGAQVRVYIKDNTVENTGHYNVTVSGVKGFYSNVTEMDSVTKNIQVFENVRATVTSVSVDSFVTDTSTALTFTTSEAVSDAGSTNDYALYVDGKAVSGAVVTITAASNATSLSVSINKDLSDEIAAGKSVKLVAKTSLDIEDGNDNIINTSDIVIK